MRSTAPLSLAALAAASALAAAACGDDFQLPPAVVPNEVDTVALYALSGTPIGLPSAYQLEFRRVVRTDQSASFDFAFDLTGTGAPVLIPTGPLGLGEGSGIQPAPLPFDSVTIAPTSGYVYDTTAAADSAVELLVQSRVTTCAFGLRSSFYAKLRVLGVDTAARRIDFAILVNANCGYRGLEPGLPTR